MGYTYTEKLLVVYPKFKLGVLYFLLNLTTLSGDSILAGTKMRLFLGMEGAGAWVPGNRRSGRKQCALGGGGRMGDMKDKSLHQGRGLLHAQGRAAFPSRELSWRKDGETSFKGEQGKWFHFSGC